MRFLILLLILLLVGSVQGLTNVQVSEVDRPQGVVILLVEGMGSSYVYPEYYAQPQDGRVLGRALLYNLTAGGARILDMRVPVPNTKSSISVLMTGCSWADSDLISASNVTLLDAAKNEDFICIGILQHAHPTAFFPDILSKLDGVLLMGNSEANDKPIVGAREDLPPEIAFQLQGWKNEFSSYNHGQGVENRVNCNAWTLDVASDLVRNIDSAPFFILIDLSTVNRSGQDYGPDGYLMTLAGLDAPLGKLISACQSEDVLLLVTADRGMSFNSVSENGISTSFECHSEMDSLRIPAVFFGPNVDNFTLSGIWSQSNLAPSILDLMVFSQSLPWAEGKSMPIKERYDLKIEMEKEGPVEIYKLGDLMARSDGDQSYLFSGLERGNYNVKVGSQMTQVSINGDQILNLTSSSRPLIRIVWPDIPELNMPELNARMIVGVILIFMVNFLGIMTIIRIVRKG